MTTTYDPYHPAYFDEADLRSELTRVYDLCHGCRLCFKFCTSFPTLFDFIDDLDLDASKLSERQQDQVVEECFGCKLCYINCPYTPDKHEWAIDFPRLMLRAEQVKRRNHPPTATEWIADQALGRTDLVGRLNSAAAPLVNAMLARPGSAPRRLMEKTVGIASQRLLPPYARQRFSTWFAKRTSREPAKVQDRAQVALFTTCIVEYQEPSIGQDLVKVYERNGIECSLPKGQRCCGAPWLHSGDVANFVKQANRNVEVLSDAVREGRDIVVPQPTCAYVIRNDYLDYLDSPNARLVAENTYDASEYLWARHKSDEAEIDTTFEGEIPEAVTYHAPCHLRAQNVGVRGRDLIKLTGAKVAFVAECSAIDGTWGYRAENYEISREVSKKLADAIERAGNDDVAGDCHLANGAIIEETSSTPRHPLYYLARAYGIAEEG